MSHSVFIGGSIVKKGGQNPLEAARYGAKIFHGPNIDNFKDVYKLLKSLQISNLINSSKKLASSINFNPSKANGNKIKKIGRRILTKTIKELDYLIKDEFKKT
jgi:3-deoxy-D-manno-octulosonic-acid transferase